MDNLRIAPINGPARMDFFLRYEKLEKDMKLNGIGFLWETFQAQDAKSGYRPRSSGTPADMFQRHPHVADLISEVCHEEIEYFGYKLPG